ncbi:tyrosine-type recombinase/integrase [Actinokineospora iranica]|uniref:Site-specific recombinase XerD n=1 Tax=Actinokineospora iranica TaxID=1271860 RepID=A0A1G6P277_9PSEU|nr:tyrosine-type recombinase/integrase [Actinokineospora iranica]SDC74051.1 Site-specific recombinase XerD [Actinokineospora iranica]
MSDPIKKITLKSGAVRYRFVIDVGRDPETSRRLQKTFTFDTKREARAEYDKIRHQTNEGSYIRPAKVTVAEYLTGWLEGATRDLRDSSKRSYRDALRPAFERLGPTAMQKVTKADIERMVTWMATEGRRRGGKPGTGLGPRSIQLTLGRLTAAFEMATLEGLIPRNVAKLVKPPKYEPAEPETWSKAEVHRFLTKAKKDRLHAAWRLSLYGLRRGEVLGLRWKDVDFGPFSAVCGKHSERWCAECYGAKHATVHVRQSRVLVEGKILIEPPKSRNGFRKLPLDARLAVALRALKVAQAAEKLAAGEGYVDSGYVVVNELGQPVHPEWYSDEFQRLSKRAGVKRIVLHEGRHTTLSLMEKAGVPISIISKWAGHYDTAFTYSTYVHADDEDLKTGTDALGRIYK